METNEIKPKPTTEKKQWEKPQVEIISIGNINTGFLAGKEGGGTDYKS